MTASPRVTICIPCYNAASSIEASVRSALDQTWPDKEVIVVDDGSTDDSLAVLNQFGDSIRVIRSNNRGGNHARNLALRCATGEWLQYLDADDYLQPAKIAQQIKEADDKPGDIIYSPVIFETSTSTGVKRMPSLIDEGLDIHAQWIAWQLPQTGGALWRKSALGALGGWKEGQPCCQEHELYMRALRAGHRFVFAPSPNAIYSIWSEGTVCRKDPGLVVYVRTALIDEMLAWLESQGLLTGAHQLIAGRAFFEMARTLAKYDVTKASSYHLDRKNRKLISLSGPAGPLAYRLAYHALGFAFTEHLAAMSRRAYS